MQLFQHANCIIDPKEVLVLESIDSNSAQTYILKYGLGSLNIPYQLRSYNRRELAYGPLPNLILRNKPYNQRQIVDKLNDIFYSSEDVMWNERHKAFTRDVSQRFRKLIHYYKNYKDTFGDVGHFTEVEMRRQCIQLLEVLKRSLIANTFDFEDKPEQRVLVPFTDIVVYCYIEAITADLPCTLPDELLRSYYSELLLWKINMKTAMTDLQKIPKPSQSRPFKQIREDLSVPFQQEEINPTFNINLQRSLVSLSIIGLLYGLFA